VAANERKFLRCAGDSLAVPWSGRPCRPCLPTSAPVRSMSWWSTRSTGAVQSRRGLQFVRLFWFDGPLGSERQARLTPQYPSHGLQAFPSQLWTTAQDMVTCDVVSRVGFVRRGSRHGISTAAGHCPKKKPWTVADRGSRSEKLRLGEKTRSFENEGIIREVLGRQLLCARHHCEWINLNRYGHPNTGLRV
jgi:hypothetical protein